MTTSPASHDRHATAGRLVADVLRHHGCRRLYGVPGETFLSVLDAVLETPDFAFRLCRQEGGAAMMAEAWARLSGTIGACIVSRGPGATNAAAGVHVARMSGTPMLLLVGVLSRDMSGRDGFQEFDLLRTFSGLAKHCDIVPTAARLEEYMMRAAACALAGRMGPVVLGIPEDILAEEVSVGVLPPVRRVAPAPRAEDMRTLAEMLAAAARPLLVLGGADWTREASDHIRQFAEAWSVPVVVEYSRQDVFDNAHPLYAGQAAGGMDPKLAERMRAADLLIAVGSRMDDFVTLDYSVVDRATTSDRLVHVYPEAEELGRVYPARLAIAAGSREFARAAADLGITSSGSRTPQVETAREAHAAYERFSTAVPQGDRDVMAQVLLWLRDRLPTDAIVASGAGIYCSWMRRFFRHHEIGTQLAAGSGSMGYSVPAAIAARDVFPDRMVVAFAGDACFLMHGQELASAAQHDLPVIVIVVNNGRHGTIRIHQERVYPGRVSGTDLRNPDFCKLSEAYGGRGERVTTLDEFQRAFERAAGAKVTSLIELVVDPGLLTPDRLLPAAS